MAVRGVGAALNVQARAHLVAGKVHCREDLVDERRQSGTKVFRPPDVRRATGRPFVYELPVIVQGVSPVLLPVLRERSSLRAQFADPRRRACDRDSAVDQEEFSETTPALGLALRRVEVAVRADDQTVLLDRHRDDTLRDVRD